VDERATALASISGALRRDRAIGHFMDLNRMRASNGGVGDPASTTRSRKAEYAMKRVMAAVAVVALVSPLGAFARPALASSPTTTTSVPVFTDYAWVPVVTCATSTGINETPPPVTERTRLLKVPSNLLGGVTFYTDAFRWVTPLVGPANWNCAVQEGADGTYGIMIQPPGSSSGREFISASSDGPCATCVYAVACPWLSKALRRSEGLGIACPKLPHRETDRVVSISRDTSAATIFITDPPGVSGSLTSAPSGRYASEGYVVYNVDQHEAFSMGCALPKGMADLCHLVEAEFIASKWGQR
jgi:hypothetical protein